MKNLVTIVITLLIVTFSYFVCMGQSSNDNQGSIASVDFEKYGRSISFEIKDTKIPFNYKKIRKPIDIFYDISDVDMSTTIDLMTNTLNFSGIDNLKYSKMQLTHKYSSETIISRKIDADYKINLDKITPGTYFLILSNEKGDIKTEEITILK